MISEKISDFIKSEDYNKLVEDLSSFLGFTWGDTRMAKLLIFVNEVLKENLKKDSLKASAQKWLDFLEETKRNEFLDYFEKNWRTVIEKLWQEESLKDEENEETFEEREKRYLELMKEIINLPTKETKETQSKEKKKVITFETKEVSPKKEVLINWQLQKEKDIELPEGTIIIKKKEEKRKIDEEREDFLDLSNL